MRPPVVDRDQCVVLLARQHDGDARVFVSAGTFVRVAHRVVDQVFGQQNHVVLVAEQLAGIAQAYPEDVVLVADLHRWLGHAAVQRFRVLHELRERADQRFLCREGGRERQ